VRAPEEVEPVKHFLLMLLFLLFTGLLTACGAQASAPPTTTSPSASASATSAATAISIHVVASVARAEGSGSDGYGYIGWRLCALDQSNAPVAVTAFAFSRSIRYSAGWVALPISHSNPGSAVPNCVDTSANKAHALGAKFSGTVTYHGVEPHSRRPFDPPLPTHARPAAHGDLDVRPPVPPRPGPRPPHPLAARPDLEGGRPPPPPPVGTGLVIGGPPAGQTGQLRRDRVPPRIQ
jgi:hypothetical protein